MLILFVNDKWEGIWKEAAVNNFNVISWHMAGGSDENRRNLSQDSHTPVKDSNPGRMKKGCYILE
jgi:hypothetical protein